MTTRIWKFRFEVVGFILLVIAISLTILTGNGFGIVSLFAAGVFLCLFNILSRNVCSLKKPSYSIGECSHSYPSQKLVQIQEEDEAKQSMDNEGGNQTNRRR